MSALVDDGGGAESSGAEIETAMDDSMAMEMGGMSTDGAMSMGSEAMEHMEPLSTEGVTGAPVDRGGVPLKGTRRGGALEFELFAPTSPSPCPPASGSCATTSAIT